MSDKNKTDLHVVPKGPRPMLPRLVSLAAYPMPLNPTLAALFALDAAGDVWRLEGTDGNLSWARVKIARE